VIAAADPKGNGPWCAQEQGTEKEQQAPDLLNGYIHLGVDSRVIKGVDCETAQKLTNKAFTNDKKGAYERR
jgi:hypothetical protein